MCCVEQRNHDDTERSTTTTAAATTHVVTCSNVPTTDAKRCPYTAAGCDSTTVSTTTGIDANAAVHFVLIVWTGDYYHHNYYSRCSL
jgi:hypothetical protein